MDNILQYKLRQALAMGIFTPSETATIQAMVEFHSGDISEVPPKYREELEALLSPVSAITQVRGQ